MNRENSTTGNKNYLTACSWAFYLTSYNSKYMATAIAFAQTR